MSYEDQQIDVLEGLEAVRVRPRMYVGSVGSPGLHQLIWEVVHNSVDECLAGHCDQIEVTLNEDNSITVEDNGRGIPTDIVPRAGKSAEKLFSLLFYADVRQATKPAIFSASVLQL